MAVAGIICLLAAFASQVALGAEPRRVMLLHSFGRDFGPWSEYAKTIRTELDRQSPWPLDIIDQSLVTARFSDENPEAAFVEYLRALFAKHPLDLIVSLGAPGAAFVQRHRQQIFPTTPLLFTAVEQRRIQFGNLTENDAVVAVSHDFPALFENILRVLPNTKTVAVVNGRSPFEQFWEGEIRREAKPFESRIAFKWYNELSFEDILKDAAALPPQSAIFWHLMSVDAAGVVYEGDASLKRLRAVANAPIFSYDDSFFGGEIVGGPMHSVLNLSRQTAAVAIRILGGEKAGDIKTLPSGFAAPKFDWREMQRWGISESRLPLGSEIFFRDATAWEQYGVLILTISAMFLVQTTLICWLLYEYRRRHRAEVGSRNAIAELTYMNRRAAAGELSASIAHEVNQPLTAITTGAGAALRWLRAETPNPKRAEAALEQIVAAGHRAGDIITNVKSMFAKDTQAKSQVDINKLIWTVLGLVYIDLRQHQIELQTELDDQLPPVLGNPVQLQQVILNLVMNAIDSMRSSERRVLSVKSELNETNCAQVSIDDTGTGIDPSNLDQIFSALFTTKARGMGMGLSICHSIMEAHNGRISVSQGVNRGSIFQFELPTKSDKDKVAIVA